MSEDPQLMIRSESARYFLTGPINDLLLITDITAMSFLPQLMESNSWESPGESTWRTQSRWGGPAHRGPGSHSERLRGRLGIGINAREGERNSRCSLKYRCTDGGETEESNPEQIHTAQLLNRWHYDDHIAQQMEYFRGDECPMPALQLRVTFRGANTCLVSGQRA